jgi:hypothetical protein
LLVDISENPTSEVLQLGLGFEFSVSKFGDLEF